MKTKLKILIKNKEKRIYQDIWTGDLFIKYNGEKLRCEWSKNGFMNVAFLGKFLVKEII